MTYFWCKKIYKIIILLKLLIFVNGDLQDYLNLQHRRTHFPDTNFRNNDYQDEEMEETQQVENNSGWNGESLRHEESLGTMPDVSNISSNLDSNIKWIKNWTSSSDLGQLSAVDIDPNGNIAVFSRGSRTWGQGTFTYDNKFDFRNGPIPENVITLLNKEGKRIIEWGKNTFYLPHGLTIDLDGNYWVTDVAMHMIMKFDAKEIEKNMEILVKLQISQESSQEYKKIDKNNLFINSIVKPSLVLGVPFEPGNDNQRFCKPTGIAVLKNGDFFVSDGYCNSRIIKFDKNGIKLMQFGRAWPPGINQEPPPYAFFVPHALALAEDLGFLYVADRENGRILCFHENGSYHREYKNPTIGTKVYSLDYADGKIYAVNGQDIYSTFKVHGFSIEIESGKIISQFGPDGDMKGPHDITVNHDASEIYVVELDDHVVYKFVQDGKKLKNDSKSNLTVITPLKHNLGPLTSPNFEDGPKKIGKVAIIFTIIISSLVLIGLCLAAAAVIARCQKRGCLLSVPRRSYWETDKKDNFKLSSLLESRNNKRGFRLFEKRPNTKEFSKLNTEPETSEDERGEDSLII